MGKGTVMLQTVKENVGFVLICVAVVAIIVAIAEIAERHFSKKNGTKREIESGAHYLVMVAMLSAMATVLMLFEVPLPFAPSFYKIDLSELPIIVGAFALGPVAGVLIEFIKVLLNLFINGTTTVFVGEFANFIMGSSFIVPASIIYVSHKTKKNAIIGLVVGTLITTVVGSMMNAFVLLPKYAEVFQMPIEALVEMGTAVNSAITSLFTFCLFAVAPFNLLKYGLVSVITLLIYHRISRLLKAK